MIASDFLVARPVVVEENMESTKLLHITANHSSVLLPNQARILAIKQVDDLFSVEGMHSDGGGATKVLWIN